jgi:thiaminase
MPSGTTLTEAEITRPKLSEHLRERVLPLWQRQREHPFVVALGDGSLPRANFEFYIRQDALFLDKLTKAFWIREQPDTYAISLRTGEEARLHEIFLISTRYEWLFWEMAWRSEAWPS